MFTFVLSTQRAARTEEEKELNFPYTKSVVGRKLGRKRGTQKLQRQAGSGLLSGVSECQKVPEPAMLLMVMVLSTKGIFHQLSPMGEIFVTFRHMRDVSTVLRINFVNCEP
jgi:hypothetical protein